MIQPIMHPFYELMNGRVGSVAVSVLNSIPALRDRIDSNVLGISGSGLP